MEIAAYRLFYDNIHDFKTTAVHVEAGIRRHGIRSDGREEVPGIKGRTRHDMWVSMKTVSHFDLGPCALTEAMALLQDCLASAES